MFGIRLRRMQSGKILSLSMCPNLFGFSVLYRNSKLGSGRSSSLRLCVRCEDMNVGKMTYSEVTRNTAKIRNGSVYRPVGILVSIISLLCLLVT